jgi:hypothetical protein
MRKVVAEGSSRARGLAAGRVMVETGGWGGLFARVVASRRGDHCGQLLDRPVQVRIFKEM